MKKMNEKPQYGWYVKNLVINFSIIGSIGLIMVIFSFLMQGIIFLSLFISGCILIFLFLWPGIGMATINLVIQSQSNSPLNMQALNEVEAPLILDIGCGTGRTAIKIAKAMKDRGHLYGIDIYNKIAISGNALDTIKNNARIEKVDEITTFQFGTATEIPFEDNFFDIVNVSSVLHEIHDEGGHDLALDEIYRILKPEGYLYFGEWNRNSWQLIAYMGIFCLVFKSYKYWIDLLKNYGFKDVNFKNQGGFIKFEAKK